MVKHKTQRVYHGASDRIVGMANAPRNADWIDEVGRRLAATRNAMGLTQQALADQLAVSRAALANWEQGTRLPDPSAMARLARRHRITMDWIYIGDPSGLPARYATALLPKTFPSSDNGNGQAA
jgi:DNA-binding XRE family transcriptional regulator